jgi:hypothetical protein
MTPLPNSPRYVPPGYRPPGYYPPGFEVGEAGQGGYWIFRGVGAVGAIDWENPVGFCPAGSAQAVLTLLGHDPDVEYFYGARAISDAGRGEQNTSVICRVLITADGVLVGACPARPTTAQIRPAAGGRMLLAVHFIAAPGTVKAAWIQVADASGDPPLPDWDELLAELAISGSSPSIRLTRLLEETWPDAQEVCLAVRVVSDHGVPGPHLLTNVAVASDSAPSAISWLAAEQE